MQHHIDFIFIYIYIYIEKHKHTHTQERGKEVLTQKYTTTPLKSYDNF